MTNKEKYSEFFNQHNDICIFSSPWWLDATAGAENWDVILVERDGNIVAAFPYVLKRGRFGNHIGMPMLTQKLGPYIVYGEDQLNEYKRIEYENGIFASIISELPDFVLFNINFDSRCRNWLEFYWNDFKQTSKYTYRIENLQTSDWFELFEKSKRKKVRKGEKAFEFKQDLSADEFYDCFAEVIKGRNDEVSYSKDFFSRLYDAIYEHKAGKTFYCTENETGEVAAIKFIVWDSSTAYDIIGMRPKKFNSSGSTEFLTYKCIEYVAGFVNCFDFEGSMIKGVEDAYRGYGTHQTEYYNISRDNRVLIPLFKDFRNIVRKFIKK